MTGIMDSEVTRNISGLDLRLKRFTTIAIETNKEHRNFGIPQSAAITCVKPSGTVSQLTDAASVFMLVTVSIIFVLFVRQQGSAM